MHCVKIVRIRSYSGPHFPAFALNTKTYFVSLRIQFEREKMRTRITPNTDTFHAVMDYLTHFWSMFSFYIPLKAPKILQVFDTSGVKNENIDQKWFNDKTLNQKLKQKTISSCKSKTTLFYKIV